MDLDGSFILYPAHIEYAFLNPPQEYAGKMIAGINWPRIYLEITAVTLTSCISYIFSARK